MSSIHARRLTLAVLLAAIASPLSGQRPGLMVQGILDAELWSTDSGSTLLTRNKGHPGAAERLMLWGAVEPRRSLVFYVQGEAEGGSASDDGRQVELEQIGVRYTRSAALVVDAGRMPNVVGAFAGRRFSTRNPLIGVPDGYPVRYPLGVQLSGEISRFDYRAAVVSLPVAHPGYTPDPTAAARPAVGFGVTPLTGVRVGASFTAGPYLNGHLPATLLAGRSWRSYLQRIGAADAELSRGYIEVHAEFAAASYDVPGHSAVSGITYYVEPKYTLSPRLFVAARFERNDYPFIRPADTTRWIARATDFSNGELGVGFRWTASTLMKASYRADRWHITPANRRFLANGCAFALQLSQSFDALSWLPQ